MDALFRDPIRFQAQSEFAAPRLKPIFLTVREVERLFALRSKTGIIGAGTT
jgi:hypothetical protein